MFVLRRKLSGAQDIIANWQPVINGTKNECMCEFVKIACNNNHGNANNISNAICSMVNTDESNVANYSYRIVNVHEMGGFMGVHGWQHV